MKLNISFAI